jgi:hypothetical protein
MHVPVIHANWPITLKIGNWYSVSSKVTILITCRVPENCAYTPLKVTNNSTVPEATEVTSKSPRTYRLLNSGTILLQPSEKLAKEIYHYLETSPLVPTFAFPGEWMGRNFVCILNTSDRPGLACQLFWRAMETASIHLQCPEDPPNHPFKSVARRTCELRTLYIAGQAMEDAQRYSWGLRNHERLVVGLLWRVAW